MTQLSLDGYALPESEEDFEENKSRMQFTKCEHCGRPFSGLNTRTRDGWRETQMSGYCENCFDRIFE